MHLNEVHADEHNTDCKLIPIPKLLFSFGDVVSTLEI